MQDVNISFLHGFCIQLNADYDEASLVYGGFQRVDHMKALPALLHCFLSSSFSLLTIKHCKL